MPVKLNAPAARFECPLPPFPFLKLPNDLVVHIAHHIPEIPTLRNLILCSKQLYALLSPLLYRLAHHRIRYVIAFNPPVIAPDLYPSVFQYQIFPIRQSPVYIPLISYAVAVNSVYLLKALIELGVDLEQADSTGETAIARAAREGKWLFVRALMVSGADRTVAVDRAKRAGDIDALSVLGGDLLVKQGEMWRWDGRVKRTWWGFGYWAGCEY